MKTSFTRMCEYPSYPYSGLDKLLLEAVCENQRYERIWYLLRRTDAIDKQYRRKWKILDKLAEDFFAYSKDTWHCLADDAWLNTNPMEYYGLSESDFR